MGKFPEFRMVVGINSPEGITILGQELMFSEYRFRNLRPETIKTAIKRRTLLDRVDGTQKLEVPDEDRPCEILKIKRGLFYLALLWNTVTSKWELWEFKSDHWEVKTGEAVIEWMKEQKEWKKKVD